MGRLIKNHWARLIVLTAAAFQVGSAIEGFIWPKVFWDFRTKNLNGAVNPVPVLQILNLVMGVVGLAWEWPLKLLAGTFAHRSIEIRLVVYPLSTMFAALLYQGTHPAIYYLVGMGVYFWAYTEGEEHYTPSSNPPPLKSAILPFQLLQHHNCSPEMTVDTQDGNRHDECEGNDVPVNKKTTFNGRLNQYFHTSKNVTASSSSSSGKSSIPTTPETFSDDSKRKPLSQEPESDSILGNGAEPGSKRRKAVTTNASLKETLPTRITRSRSASSTPSPSPISLASTRSQSTTTKRPPRIPRQQQQPTHKSLLRDTIPPNLTLLLVGVNPGVLTGTTGFAYAHPSNLFWKLLHWSGITSIRHPPSDTYRLPELYNIGNTNIVERPTRDASMLSRAEMDAGVPVLEAKVAAQRPEVVCLVGKSIWEAVWRFRRGRGIRKEEFRYGWQDEEENMGKGDGWKGAPVFVATTTSGLAAGMSMAEKQAVWDQLGSWVVKRREERRAAGYQG